LSNGFKLNDPQGQFSMYDIATNTWTEISQLLTKHPNIPTVAGFVVKQMDNSLCDAVIISESYKIMFICRSIVKKALCNV